LIAGFVTEPPPYWTREHPLLKFNSLEDFAMKKAVAGIALVLIAAAIFRPKPRELPSSTAQSDRQEAEITLDGEYTLEETLSLVDHGVSITAYGSRGIRGSGDERAVELRAIRPPFSSGNAVAEAVSAYWEGQFDSLSQRILSTNFDISRLEADPNTPNHAFSPTLLASLIQDTSDLTLVRSTISEGCWETNTCPPVESVYKARVVGTSAQLDALEGDPMVEAMHRYGPVSDESGKDDGDLANGSGEEESDPTEAPFTLGKSMIEDEPSAIQLAMEALPPGTEPLETHARLTNAAALDNAIPGIIHRGWDAEAPMWAVLVLTSGLVGDDLIHVPAPAHDPSPLLGAIYVWDANSGFTASSKPIHDMALYHAFMTIQNQDIEISAATVSP
jgi:hypothetical protein